MKAHMTIAVLWIAVACGCAQPVLRQDFRLDPASAGWACGAGGRETLDASWVGPFDGAADGHLLVRQGRWESPAFRVEPFQYYRLRFRSRAEGRGYWACIFYDAAGKPLTADNYSSIAPSEDWCDTEACVLAEETAATARVRFLASAGAPLEVDDVVVAPVSREEVAQWADAVYAQLPTVYYAPPPNRWEHMSRTIEKFRHGDDVTIVVLGDSIANDLANSAFDVLLERSWPGAHIRLITSVEGGQGCEFYQKQNRVERYVVAHKPDLLIIAGISHGYDPEPFRSVIRQVRERMDPDILVMTDAVTPPEEMLRGFRMYTGLSDEAARQKMRDFPLLLESMAIQEKVEFMDMRRAWNFYLDMSGRPCEWFMRDPIHSNTRGMQAMARLLVQHLGEPDCKCGK